MDTRLPPEVLAFSRAATDRFARLGGVDRARLAERDRSERSVVGSALGELGLADLDARGDGDNLLAAAALCRAAGAVALPWPIVPELLRIGGARLTLVDPGAVRVDHGDLTGGWVGADLDGRAWELRPGASTGGLLGPFLVVAEAGVPAPPVPLLDIARHLTLGAWMILGALETAVGQVAQHVRDRRQFGRPLAEFQTIRFAVADVTVSVRGLEELAKFTVWRLSPSEGSEPAMADALALRLHAVDVGRAALRSCHQLYGALGFCDETDLSILDRHTQPLLRQPRSAERLAETLVDCERALVGLR